MAKRRLKQSDGFGGQMPSQFLSSRGLLGASSEFDRQQKEQFLDQLGLRESNQPIIPPDPVGNFLSTSGNFSHQSTVEQRPLNESVDNLSQIFSSGNVKEEPEKHQQHSEPPIKIQRTNRTKDVSMRGEDSSEKEIKPPRKRVEPSKLLKNDDDDMSSDFEGENEFASKTLLGLSDSGAQLGNNTQQQQQHQHHQHQQQSGTPVKLITESSHESQQQQEQQQNSGLENSSDQLGGGIDSSALANDLNHLTNLEKLSQGHYWNLCKAIDYSLKEVRSKIRKRTIDGLNVQISSLRGQLEAILIDLEDLENVQLLSAKDFKSLETLRTNINTSLIPQLNLYELDLSAINNPSSVDEDECPVYLGLIQDNAGPVFKDKQIGSFTLRLLTSARVQHITTGHIHPELVDANQRIKRNNQELENTKQVFNEVGFATFGDLKFSSGTFPNLVRLKFRVQVQVIVDNKTYTKALESEASQPYVSMTNTGSQWKDAAGAWLKEDSFKERFELSIPCFWNYFQKHYLLATKQDVSQIKRPLTLRDFGYLLMAKFGVGVQEKKTINQKEFSVFWEWIGPGLKKIRYQKYLIWLFENGYIAAFVTRKESEDQLNGSVPGTFMIRLSERLDGEFIISYKRNNGNIHHYLIQPDDTADKKRTLIDFVGTKRTFTHIIQLRNDTDGSHIFVTHSKDKALQKYYKKRPKQSQQNKNLDSNPYDESLDFL